MMLSFLFGCLCKAFVWSVELVIGSLIETVIFA